MRKVTEEDLNFEKTQPYFVLYLLACGFEIGDDVSFNFFMIWACQKHSEFRKVLGMTENEVKLKMRREEYVAMFIDWLKASLPARRSELKRKQLTLF